MKSRVWPVAGLVLAAAVSSCKTSVFDSPIDCNSCAEWNQPQAPFRIFANTYFVGVAGLSSILIDTGDGLVLIDGGLPQSARQIDANIRALGFRTEEVDYILVSHVHYDHVGGVAALQRISQATVVTSHAGAEPLSRGMLASDDPQFSLAAEQTRFPPSEGVRAVDSGTVLELGNARLRAVYTPGHTPGGVSWTWTSCDDVRCLSLVYADSLSPVSVEGYRFGGNGAGREIRASTGIVSSLDCDILLSPHPFYFDMQGRLAQEREGNPFVDNGGCANYSAAVLAQLERRLEAERGQGNGASQEAD